MRNIEKGKEGISTVLVSARIPLSGFATDIYLPSLPEMASYLNVTETAVQFSMVIFMVSGF